MAGSFKAEILKLRKRPATWILLVVLLVLLALFVAFSYFIPHALLTNLPEPPENAPAGAQQQMQQAAQNQLETLYPQNLSAKAMGFLSRTGIFAGAGSAIALILGAMAMGSEYGWDSLKTVLPRGTGRLGFLSGKFLGLGVVFVAIVVLTFIVSAISSYVIASLENASVEWPVAEILKSLGAGLLITSVWGALGAFLAVLFRSTALSVGLGLVYFLAVGGILSNLLRQNDTLDGVQKFFPGQNSSFLANSFSPGPTSQGLGLQQPPVDPAQAALVLGAYLVIFVAFSLLIFWSRDVV